MRTAANDRAYTMETLPYCLILKQPIAAKAAPTTRPLPLGAASAAIRIRTKSTPKNQKAFTLIELLVAIFLATAIILLLGQLYKMTAHSATALKTVATDWQVEQFIRQQMWRQHQELNQQLKQFIGDRQTLQFASRYSAAHSDSGPFIKANYQYNANKQTLEYSEQPYVEWWTKTGREKIASATTKPTNKSIIILKQIKNLRFTYLDSHKHWKNTWKQQKQLPQLIKIDYLRGGKKQTLILEPQVLSYSTASGF